MKQKLNLWRELLKFFTVITISCTLLLSYLLIFALNLDVYETNSFEETGTYYDYGEHRVVRNLYNYHNPESQVTFSMPSIDPETGEYLEETEPYQSELEERTLAFQKEIINVLKTDFSQQNSNIQVKIENIIENSLLLDTFGTGDYEFVTTSNYLDYEITIGVQNPLTVNDGFPSLKNTYEILKKYSEIIPVILMICSIFSIVNLMLLVKITGKRKGEEEIILKGIDKIPTELFLFIIITSIAVSITFTIDSFYNIFYSRNTGIDQLSLQILNILAFIIGYLMMKAVEMLTIRIKMKTIFKNSLLFMSYKLILNFFKKIPIIWRTAVISTVVCTVNGILGMLSMYHFFYWFIFALYNFIILLFLCTLAWQMKLLQSAAESLVTGNFQEKIDTKRMYFDCKKYGETLNQIGDSIGLAVEEKFRSQRMKTELITNVSHDIKTPLTSIVTCVELLQKEHTETEHQEHLDLLQRQSMRMKKLVEDLVEASKATTGNLSVNLMETDLVEAVQQALGEYEDKFSAKNLQIVPTYHENCVVQADGKHLWRVLDNLLSNVSKYAQSGTRVYISVEKIKDNTEISIKNISAEPLNVRAEDLLERFVRGDESRSTEGSGLGLNIAQSLMQVQGGSLKLSIDGDLLKVELIF